MRWCPLDRLCSKGQVEEVKKLDQMIVRETVVPFFVGSAVFVLLFQMNFLIAWFKTFNPQNVPLVGVLQLMILKTPEFLVQVLPLGTALGLSLAFARLARESELTATRAATAPMWRTFWPIFVIGASVSGLAFVNVELLQPRAERRFNDLSRKLAVIGMSPGFATNVSVKVNSFNLTIGTVSKQADGTSLFSNVLLVEHQEQTQTMLIKADSAVYDRGVITLKKPTTWIVAGQDLVSLVSDKERMVINAKIDIESITNGGMNVAQELSLQQLREKIKLDRSLGQDTRFSEVTYYSRYSTPFSCLLFALVGPLFSTLFARRGAFIGVIVSLFLLALHYNATVISQQILGRAGWAPPVLAAWLPNIVILILGLSQIRRLERFA